MYYLARARVACIVCDRASMFLSSGFRIRAMTVIYPSWIECLIFVFLGVICGLVVKFIYLLIREAVRSVLCALRERRKQGKVHAEGAGWDEAIAAFKRTYDSPS